MKKVLVIYPHVEEKYRTRLEELLAESFELLYSEDGEIDDAMYPQAEIILGVPKSEKLALCSSLRWLHLCISGVDGYLSSPYLSDDVLLTCSSGAFGEAIAEFLVTYTLMLMKHIPLMLLRQYSRRWDRQVGTLKSICGSTVLVVGLGNIGSEYARRVKAMDAHVIGVRRTVSDVPDCVDELYTVDKLDELLPLADVVALCMPETGETKAMFGIERFVKMKPGAILLNVGRGSAIVTDELIQVLNSGHLGGAALDVTDPEPLPADSPLWKMPNVIITPHISGGNENLKLTHDKLMQLMVENVSRVVADSAPLNIVDRRTGYRRRDSRTVGGV